MTMRYLIFGIIICSLSVVGCDPGANSFFGKNPPAAPTGLSTLALDKQVELWWDPSPENNIESYNIYTTSSAGGRYYLIGTTTSPQFVHRSLTNGVTYYYAVSAINRDGDESELSHGTVLAIPRPEGFSLALFNFISSPNAAGYDFSSETFGPYDDDYTDIYFGSDGGSPTMYVWTDTDIQDMGYTRDLDEIITAPDGGWSPTKKATLIDGHTYVVRTWDDHYAKFRVVNIFSDHVLVDWAYQTLASSPNLKHRPAVSGPRLPLIPSRIAVE